MESISTFFQLNQLIKAATRMTDRTEPLIDLVFTNVPFKITMNDVYALSFSEHNLIGLIVSKTERELLRKLFVLVITVNMTITS